MAGGMGRSIRTVTVRSHFLMRFEENDLTGIGADYYNLRRVRRIINFKEQIGDKDYDIYVPSGIYTP